MAERIAALEDYLTCFVCLETFKDPVTLSCNHNFCSSCLQGHWDQNNTRSCPVCRRKSSKDVIIVNFALKELCISFTEKQTSESRAGVCSSHPTVPSLFCLDETWALCPVCEFSQHNEHTVVSLEEAETQLKQQLHSELQALLKHRVEVQSLEQLYKDIQHHSEREADLCKAHIRAEFSRLHQFLKEEEELRLKALREEQSRQTQTVSSELSRVRQTLASVELSIQELQTQLQKTTQDFIYSYKPAQRLSQPLLPPGPGLHLNQAKVLRNLGFRAWRKMGRIVQFSPVILDPNTAHPHLHLSQDLSSLSKIDSPLQLPDNPERFLRRPLVLSYEGFSSGTHQWDVEVGDHPDWKIGVAFESVNRKTQPLLIPDHGFFILGHCYNQYFTGTSIVKLKQCPLKIRIHLDYENGTVSFYDTNDMSLIFIHKYIFTEKLFPCFSVGSTEADSQTKNITICPDPAQAPV